MNLKRESPISAAFIVILLMVLVIGYFAISCAQVGANQAELSYERQLRRE